MLTIKELLKSSSEDTGVSPLRMRLKSTSELTKWLEACPKSDGKGVLGFSSVGVRLAFCFPLSD